MPTGDSPGTTAPRTSAGATSARKRKQSGSADGATAAPNVQPTRTSPRASGGTGGQTKRVRKSKPTIFKWKAQKMGLPEDVRGEMKDLIKTGKTAGERAEETAAIAAAAAARAAAQAAAAAAEAPAPEEPKRSHHKQHAKLTVQLRGDWVHVEERGPNGLHGIRKSLPSVVRAAASRSKGCRGQMYRFRVSPQFKAMNDHFCERFNRKREIKKKNAAGTRHARTKPPDKNPRRPDDNSHPVVRAMHSLCTALCVIQHSARVPHVTMVHVHVMHTPDCCCCCCCCLFF